MIPLLRRVHGLSLRILLVVALTLSLLPLVAAEAGATTSGVRLDDQRVAERAFIERINMERTNRGLSRLTESLQMARIGRGWSATMARRDDGLAHNPHFAAQVDGPWTRIAENVGRSWRPGLSVIEHVDASHTGFMNSPGHRDNILGGFNQVGVGVVFDGSGQMWVTVDFLNGPRDRFPLYRDVAGQTHEGSINALWVDYVVTGCRADGYCPGRDLTRREMAMFVARSLRLDPVSVNRFSDVSGPEAGAINALADAGIIQGCGGGRFCPDARITRGQMATFLANAGGLSPVLSVSFTDVPSTHTHAGSINAVARSGVALGCGDSRYCPAANVTRAQIATFLSRL